MLEIEPLSAILQSPPAEEPSLWGPGVLPKPGLVNVNGPTKIGKSKFTLNLALALSNGQRFLDMDSKPARTFIIQQEVTRRSIYERGVAMLRGFSEARVDSIYLSKARSWDLSRDSYMRTFKEIISFLRPDLVVIDPISYVYLGDENNNQEVGGFLRRLTDIAHAWDTCILFVHHQRKHQAQEGEGHYAERSRGASAWITYPDSIITIRASRGSTMLSFALRRAAPMDDMVVGPDEFLWFQRLLKRGDLTTLRTFLETGPLGAKALADQVVKATGVSDRTARRYIKQAIEAKIIAQGEGFLTLP